LEANLRPSQSVIDAVKLALEDETSVSELSRIAGIAKSMADFYLNNYDVTLNQYGNFAFDGV
jgi:hypothetical protein